MKFLSRKIGGSFSSSGGKSSGCVGGSSLPFQMVNLSLGYCHVILLSLVHCFMDVNVFFCPIDVGVHSI